MGAEPSVTASTLGTVISSVAAGISVICAVLSYRLNRRIHEENKADDRLAFGTPFRPDLREREHSKSVIQLDVFNKSKRKAFVEAVAAYDRKSRPIDITWSGTIDGLGMPERPSGILGVIDTSTICIRRNDGEEFNYARITFKHSFSETRSVVTFEPYAEFIRAAERAGAHAG